jgi:hypothetical protein
MATDPIIHPTQVTALDEVRSTGNRQYTNVVGGMSHSAVTLV